MQTLLPNKELILAGECSDGNETLAFLEKNKVDVILMDYSMKYIGGVEATTLVKQYHKQIKVVGFSSHQSPSVKEEMLSAGADDYLVKGVDIFTVRNTILSVVENK